MNNYSKHETAIVETDEIGDNTKIWAFSHISKNVRIGKNCMIGEGVHIGPNVVIGDNCKIQNHSLLYEGVSLEDNVFLGPNTVTTNDINPSVFGDFKQENRFRKTLFKNGSSCGANCVIVCGIIIHENASIGAGSVVTKSIEKNAMAYGNPAKVIYIKGETL